MIRVETPEPGALEERMGAAHRGDGVEEARGRVAHETRQQSRRDAGGTKLRMDDDSADGADVAVGESDGASALQATEAEAATERRHAGHGIAEHRDANRPRATERVTVSRRHDVGESGRGPRDVMKPRQRVVVITAS